MGSDSTSDPSSFPDSNSLKSLFCISPPDPSKYSNFMKSLRECPSLFKYDMRYISLFAALFSGAGNDRFIDYFLRLSSSSGDLGPEIFSLIFLAIETGRDYLPDNDPRKTKTISGKAKELFDRLFNDKDCFVQPCPKIVRILSDDVLCKTISLKSWDFSLNEEIINEIIESGKFKLFEKLLRDSETIQHFIHADFIKKLIIKNNSDKKGNYDKAIRMIGSFFKFKYLLLRNSYSNDFSSMMVNLPLNDNSTLQKRENFRDSIKTKIQNITESNITKDDIVMLIKYKMYDLLEYLFINNRYKGIYVKNSVVNDAMLSILPNIFVKIINSGLGDSLRIPMVREKYLPSEYLNEIFEFLKEKSRLDLFSRCDFLDLIKLGGKNVDNLSKHLEYYDCFVNPLINFDILLSIAENHEVSGLIYAFARKNSLYGTDLASFVVKCNRLVDWAINGLKLTKGKDSEKEEFPFYDEHVPREILQYMIIYNERDTPLYFEKLLHILEYFMEYHPYLYVRLLSGIYFMNIEGKNGKSDLGICDNYEEFAFSKEKEVGEDVRYGMACLDFIYEKHRISNKLEKFYLFILSHIRFVLRAFSPKSEDYSNEKLISLSRFLPHFKSKELQNRKDYSLPVKEIPNIRNTMCAAIFMGLHSVVSFFLTRNDLYEKDSFEKIRDVTKPFVDMFGEKFKVKDFLSEANGLICENSWNCVSSCATKLLPLLLRDSLANGEIYTNEKYPKAVNLDFGSMK